MWIASCKPNYSWRWFVESEMWNEIIYIWKKTSSSGMVGTYKSEWKYVLPLPAWRDDYNFCRTVELRPFLLYLLKCSTAG